ncbi:MAG TPA: CobD/CbiB family protein [Burkholderiales bacterium]|nr:CobD/CbiB family protein [Burkholderiales bacterium]
MSFLCVVAALFLEQLRPLYHPSVFELSFSRYASRLSRDLNAGQSVHGTVGWAVGVLPWLILVLLVHYLLTALNPLLGWAWAVAVLYACIDFKATTRDYSAITDALRAGELEKAREQVARWRGEPATQWSESDIARAAIETVFIRGHRDLLGLIAWFVVLPGPTGAVLYKLSAILADEWGRRTDEEFRAFGYFSSRVFEVLDWVPVRLTAIAFAIAGDFEDALQCWRGQSQAWLDPQTGVILASGAGALGVKLGGPLPKQGGVDYRPQLGTGEDPDANYMQSALGLIWRTLVIWLIVLLLVTLARWVGA